MKYKKLFGIYNKVSSNALLLSLLVYLLFFALLFKIQFSFETLSGYDSWIHIKMARMMLESGIIKEFPWMQYSIFQWYFADQNLLFHIFQMPFAVGDLIFGAKLAAVVFSAAFSAVFFYILKKQEVAIPFLWTALIFSSYFLLFRISISKVVPVYLLFTLMGYYFISEKKNVSLFFLSFFFVWLHSSFIMLGIMCILYTLVSWQYHGKFDLKPVLYCALGIVCGFVINPYFPNDIFIWYTQAVEIGLLRPSEMTNYGVEWLPITDFNNLFFMLYFFFGFFAASVYFFAKGKKSMNQFFVLLLIIIFGFLAYRSHRQLEFLIPFVTIFCAISLSKPIRDFQKGGWRKGFLSDANIALLLICVFFLFRIYTYEMGADDLSGFSECSDWLKNNTEHGSIVSSRWDTFPMLFHYNTWNYYIIGMDMGFLYKYNRTLYFLYDDAVFNYKIKLAETMKDYFNSSYYVAGIFENPMIYQLSETANFTFGNDICGVYKL